jgi:hypothetical protein
VTHPHRRATNRPPSPPRLPSRPGIVRPVDAGTFSSTASMRRLAPVADRRHREIGPAGHPGPLAALFQAGQEVGVVAVLGVGGHAGVPGPPGPGLVQPGPGAGRGPAGRIGRRPRPPPTAARRRPRSRRPANRPSGSRKRWSGCRSWKPRRSRRRRTRRGVRRLTRRPR